jgi:transposase InsO family protein
VSKARLVLTAVTVEKRSVAEISATYGVSRSWVYELLARHRREGDTAFTARSRRPRTTPNATPADVVDLIVRLRKELTDSGLDAGPATIAWHLQQNHGRTVARATVARHLTARGLIVPQPRKRPRSSYIRFAADQPGECWQADYTHYRLTPPGAAPCTGSDVEILTWLDDCTRYALSVTTHTPVTGRVVADTFLAACTLHGTPTSTLTDNGMVFTTRLSGGKGGRNQLETQLRRLGVTQKNSRPNHPTTCGKVERFQQTLKRYLRAQPAQPATVEQLQGLIDTFVEQYNHHRPHRSLPHHATPAALYDSLPHATITPTARAGRDRDTHDRVRRDRVDASGKITLRYDGRLLSIGIGRAHARTRVLVLAQDRHVRVVHARTGELLRELTLDPTRRYQPRHT